MYRDGLMLKSALKKNDKPELFNTDQGSQFISPDFTKILKEHEIQISMDEVEHSIMSILRGYGDL